MLTTAVPPRLTRDVVYDVDKFDWKVKGVRVIVSFHKKNKLSYDSHYVLI
jgi:hypothetical protein